MSLPSFKFTNIGAPTNNESVNSGLSSSSKMSKVGIMAGIKEKAQDTFKDMKMPEISLETSDRTSGVSDTDSDSFFSFASLVKLIIIILIIWFMWSSLSTNGDFHLGMGEFGDKVNAFLKYLEDKGREVISRITNKPLPPAEKNTRDSSDDSDDSDDSDESSSDDDHKPPKKRLSPSAHRPPVPPDATNSSDKKPGFITDDTKYTFLDKAERNYTGPAPRADDSTSVTQKHQTGKGGYCYIGEDRGFRSCVKVEPTDKCMSGEIFSRHEICIDPTLRE